jgi:hypothetical protein
LNDEKSIKLRFISMPADKIVKNPIKKTVKASGNNVEIMRSVKLLKSTKPEKLKSSKASSEEKKVKKIKYEKTKMSISKFDEFVCEAIAALETEEDQWISERRIAQYLVDFCDRGLWQTFKKKTRNVLEKLKDQKLLKNKKNKYAFTSLGEKKLKPIVIPKRKKIKGREKKQKIENTVEEHSSSFTKSGRESKPVVK